MKKTLSLLLAMVMLMTLLSGCGAKQASNTEANSTAEKEKPSYTFKYAELNPDGHIMAESGKQFAKLVSEKSNGRIKIEVFPAGQLGDEKTMYQTLQMGGGAIDIARGNTNSLGDFGAKKLTLFGLPFIFRDRAHLWNVLDSEIGEEFLGEPQEIGSGMVGLFYLDEGARHFFTSKKIAIDSIEDFKGLKLRVPTNDLMTDTVGALGVQSTPISFSELYSALQTGTVDGAEQPYSGYYSNKFYEVAPNYVLTGHTYSPSIVLMSESVWSKLDTEDQNLIMEAAKETEKWNRENIEKLDSELLEQIKAAGANVIEVPDKTPYIEATKGVVSKYAAGSEKYYDAILAK
ncbi:tripartite ATP-independent transporter DctP family solute receptor [Anaerosolibacter carboniphilus]|uniref:Tripartite ATP-independent transporter DctP family solute receptor n=1 Tax=Anaerosolibacter carboniphilus TaxID=1417629 RepID=A0A841KPR4_9FIRM|nr:TRAP transporter substrate-binding protein [Anaerosolibacter carboniphilus]MBB6215321.1 tripartite ATP-independent transporter DctP family solute receptor [Anaerosolibacter carboniphilus]